MGDNTSVFAMAMITKPEQHVLSNGIPVILQHHEGPAAALYWWVQTGSADEGKGEEGFAHFLEHMLFKDSAAKETGMASTGKMAREIESLGGEVNAYTSFDQTVYHVTCAAQHWEKVIDAFGVMAKPQRFLKSDFDREREVILEELRKNEDSPSRQLFQGLFSATYKKHPYGRPVIGFARTLKAANVGRLEKFYTRSYSSDRMGLVVVGPVTPARTKGILKLLEKRYGSQAIPSRKSQRPGRPMEAELRPAASTVAKTFDVKTPTLAISFRAPDLKHRDIPALDLGSGVLGMGELSRLYQSLFYGSSLVTDVSGALYVPYDPGMLYFQAETTDVSKLPQVAEKVFQELARMRDQGPTEAELKRVLVNAESERLYATQTADGMAGRLGFMRFVLGDLGYDQGYLTELREVDAARIREVANQYFDYHRMSAVVLLPKEVKNFDLSGLSEMAERILPPRNEPKPKAAKKKAAPSILPDVITRPSGIRVVHRENPNSHVLSVHGAVLGGLRLELGQPLESAKADWGSSHMMSLTWTKGTAKRNAQEIAAIVEGRAAGLDGFAGRNTVGLQLTGLARDWKALSEIYSEVLTGPTFPKAEVDHSRRVVEDSIRGIEDHSSQLCSKLFLETLFEEHPYGHMTMGSLESVAGFTPEKLRNQHRRWIRPDRLVLSIVGAVRRPEVEAWIEDLERQLKSASGVSPVAQVAEEPELKGPRWVEKSLGREQLHIIVGGLGTRIGADDRMSIQILQTLLGGQSGRLFIELREKRSLAYTVAPVSFDGIERGYIGTYIACARPKRDEALAGIAAVLEKLAEKGPSTSEMKRAKEFYLGRRAMDLQSDSSIAAHYGLETVYGIPLKDETQITAEVNRVTARDIQAVCRKYLVEPYRVTSIVG